MEYTILNNGIKMPMEGFSVFQIVDPLQCERAVLNAISVGYRLIDIAATNMNEEAVGAAIAKSGVLRHDLFIASKLWLQDNSYDGAKRAFEASLRKLGLEYLDLYLIYKLMGDYTDAYRAMEDLYKEGRVRAIGVCNCSPHLLADICKNAEVLPTVNQIEFHPFFQQNKALQTMKTFEVQPQIWEPLAEGTNSFFSNPILAEIGSKYGKTAAQVALRWNIQRGVAVVPRSIRREDMEQNINIWNFRLTNSETEEISRLDTCHSEMVDPYDLALAGTFQAKKIHV